MNKKIKQYLEENNLRYYTEKVESHLASDRYQLFFKNKKNFLNDKEEMKFLFFFFDNTVIPTVYNKDVVIGFLTDGICYLDKNKPDSDILTISKDSKHKITRIQINNFKMNINYMSGGYHLTNSLYDTYCNEGCTNRFFFHYNSIKETLGINKQVESVSFYKNATKIFLNDSIYHYIMLDTTNNTISVDYEPRIKKDLDLQSFTVENDINAIKKTLDKKIDLATELHQLQHDKKYIATSESNLFQNYLDYFNLFNTKKELYINNRKLEFDFLNAVYNNQMDIYPVNTKFINTKEGTDKINILSEFISSIEKNNFYLDLINRINASVENVCSQVDAIKSSYKVENKQPAKPKI